METWEGQWREIMQSTCISEIIKNENIFSGIAVRSLVVTAI